MIKIPYDARRDSLRQCHIEQMPALIKNSPFST
jgi:hypothetical protein